MYERVLRGGWGLEPPSLQPKKKYNKREWELANLIDRMMAACVVRLFALLWKRSRDRGVGLGYARVTERTHCHAQPHQIISEQRGACAHRQCMLRLVYQCSKKAVQTNDRSIRTQIDASRSPQQEETQASSSSSSFRRISTPPDSSPAKRCSS